MDWLQVLSLFLANAGLIIWFRAESRADWRHIDAKTDAIRSEIREFQKEVMEERREFHGRLCSIEERNKK